jgi:hypothetical protein
MTEQTTELSKTAAELEAELAELRAKAQETADAIHEEVEEGLEDFDAFWSSRKRKTHPVKIGGRIIHLPPSLPLQFELEARKLQRSKGDQDVRKLVGIIFGQDSMEHFAEAGMDVEQFQVLLAWAPRRIAGELGEDGKPLTIAQVAAEVAERQAAQEQADEDGEPDPS